MYSILYPSQHQQFQLIGFTLFFYIDLPIGYDCKCNDSFEDIFVGAYLYVHFTRDIGTYYIRQQQLTAPLFQDSLSGFE